MYKMFLEKYNTRAIINKLKELKIKASTRLNDYDVLFRLLVKVIVKNIERIAFISSILSLYLSLYFNQFLLIYPFYKSYDYCYFV